MLLKILAEVNKIKDENDKSTARIQTSWRSSSLGSCLRGQFANRLFSGEFQVIHDQRTKEVFELGNMIEEKYIQDFLMHPDWLVIQQGEMIDPIRKNSGHFDVMLINKKTYEVIVGETKSKNSRAFTYMDKKGEGAMHHHELQTYSYLDMINQYGFHLPEHLDKAFMDINELAKLNEKEREIIEFLTDEYVMKNIVDLKQGKLSADKTQTTIIKFKQPIKYGYILYISKDDQRKLEYPVLYPDTNLQNEYYLEREILNDAWENKKALPPNQAGTWQSKYCNYCNAGICEQLDTDEKVVALFEEIAKNNQDDINNLI